ncbi:transporter [Winogradskyella sp. 3972H.M.0a.05]|uniref:transporter n=1 Tax=Winogradskyella sp. 3972H.M.0a.05 TaxID=2950277 RepID=UPI003395FF49
MISLRNNLTILLLLFGFFASAQYTDVINSNRPGASQSAFAVGKSVLQFEVGPYLVKEEHTPLRYEVSGFGADFAVRYGLLFEELEIQLDGTYQNDTFKDMRSAITSEDSRANFKRLTIGAKYLVYDPYKKEGEEKPNLYSWKANRQFKWKYLIPAVSVYAGANFDTKNNPYTGPDVEGFSPKVMVATQNNLPGGWVFVMNLIKDRIGSDYSDFQYILTLTHSFHPQWAIFGETQGIKGDFYSDNIFRVGGGYLWTKDLQLDASIAFNTKDTPSIFNFNFGVSYRLDFHQDPENGASANEEGKRRSRKKGKKKKKDKENGDEKKENEKW